MDRHAADYDRYHANPPYEEEDDDIGEFESYIDTNGRMVKVEAGNPKDWGPKRRAYFETRKRVEEIHKAQHISHEQELTQAQHTIRNKAFRLELEEAERLRDQALKQYKAATGEWRLVKATCGGFEKIFGICLNDMEPIFSRWVEETTGYKVGGSDGRFVYYTTDIGESGKLLI